MQAFQSDECILRAKRNRADRLADRELLKQNKTDPAINKWIKKADNNNKADIVLCSRHADREVGR